MASGVYAEPGVHDRRARRRRLAGVMRGRGGALVPAAAPAGRSSATRVRARKRVTSAGGRGGTGWLNGHAARRRPSSSPALKSPVSRAAVPRCGLRGGAVVSGVPRRSHDRADVDDVAAAAVTLAAAAAIGRSEHAGSAGATAARAGRLCCGTGWLARRSVLALAPPGAAAPAPTGPSRCSRPDGRPRPTRCYLPARPFNPVP